MFGHFDHFVITLLVSQFYKSALHMKRKKESNYIFNFAEIACRMIAHDFEWLNQYPNIMETSTEAKRSHFERFRVRNKIYKYRNIACIFAIKQIN